MEHTSVLLSTFGINSFKTQILFYSFDVSLTIDYQVGRLRSLSDNVHQEFLAKYHCLIMMFNIPLMHLEQTRESCLQKH